MDDKWRKTSCPSCHNGMIWSYTYDEPIECSECSGGSIIFIRPTGHCFEWPGGSALGMWSKEEYKRGTPVMPYDWHGWLETDEEIDKFEITYYGGLDLSNIVHCSCGWVGTIGDHDIHVKEKEKEFIEEHRSNE